MIRLALIGDTELGSYTIADRLWELLSVVTNRKYKFEVVPLATDREAVAFFDGFKKDRSFACLRINPPWRDLLLERPEIRHERESTTTFSIIYKDGEGSLVGGDVEPAAVQLALEARTNLYKQHTILILSSGMAGTNLGRHFSEQLAKTTYLYDALMSDPQPNTLGEAKLITSAADLVTRKYDIVINMTPFGRHHWDQPVVSSSAPLDLRTLTQITHENSIIQEINCAPRGTLLLQMAECLGLATIPGELAMVFAATESLKRFAGITLDENTVRMLTDEISTYIAER